MQMNLSEFLKLDDFIGSTKDVERYRKRIRFKEIKNYILIALIIVAIPLEIISLVQKKNIDLPFLVLIFLLPKVVWDIKKFRERKEVFESFDKGTIDLSKLEKVLSSLANRFIKCYEKGYNKSYYDFYTVHTGYPSMSATLTDSFWIGLAVGKRLFRLKDRIEAKRLMKDIRAFNYRIDSDYLVKLSIKEPNSYNETLKGCID